MEVLYFQLIIIFSVALTAIIFGLRKAMIVSVLWSLWTFLALFYAPLIVVQLVSVWGTYFMLRAVINWRLEIKELNAALKAYPADVQKDIKKEVQKSKVCKIYGKQHKGELYKALDEAEERIVILSGWITKYVVDKKFTNKILQALEKDIQIYIGYGWQNSYSNHHTPMQSSHEAIKQLRKIQATHKGKLLIKEFPNHQKCIITDASYVIVGSHNWLSNNKYKNEEFSIKIYSEQLANEEFKRVVRKFRLP